MPHIDIMATVFPVVATTGDTSPPHELARPDFFGTAFGVAPGVFMTAAHVVEAAVSHGHLAIGGPAGAGALGGRRVDQYELFPERDVALLFCHVSGVTPLTMWLQNRAQSLTDVSSFGYPHAITRDGEHEDFAVVFRAYKGYVITTRGFQLLPGKPAVYEVSCPYPEGMSGAPVLWSVRDELLVVGVVLGVDSVEYGGVAHRVGIAMIVDEIAPLESARLGGPIADRLGVVGATWAPGAE